jgi:hypothetical protein
MERGAEPSGRAPRLGRPRRALRTARARLSPALPRPSTTALEKSTSGISRSDAALGPTTLFFLLGFFIAPSFGPGRSSRADYSNHVVVTFDAHHEENPCAFRCPDRNDSWFAVLPVRKEQSEGSSKTVLASSNETPCLRRLLAAFSGSQSKATFATNWYYDLLSFLVRGNPSAVGRRDHPQAASQGRTTGRESCSRRSFLFPPAFHPPRAARTISTNSSGRRAT